MKKDTVLLFVAMLLASALLSCGASYKLYKASAQRPVRVDILFSGSDAATNVRPKLLKTWRDAEAGQVFGAWDISSNLTGCPNGLRPTGRFVLRVMSRNGAMLERRFALDGTIEPFCQSLTPQSRDFYLRLLADTTPVMEQRRIAIAYRATQQAQRLSHH